jgi:hypothetical protein
MHTSPLGSVLGKRYQDVEDWPDLLGGSTPVKAL